MLPGGDKLPLVIDPPPRGLSPIPSHSKAGDAMIDLARGSLKAYSSTVIYGGAIPMTYTCEDGAQMKSSAFVFVP